MTGGLSFQTKEFLIGVCSYSRNDAEVYFETDDWGQRGIRIYDPDYYIIEISETLQQVCQCLSDEGPSLEEISKKTMLSVKSINKMTRKEMISSFQWSIITIVQLQQVTCPPNNVIASIRLSIR